MANRFVSIWFRHLSTDWFTLRQPDLNSLPFVLRVPSHGQMVISATNSIAENRGINKGMALADARAIIPELKALDDRLDLKEKLLNKLAGWCIRFTPLVSVDPPDGLLFDATGCSHLWGGDTSYIDDVSKRITARGYDVRIAMADTIGAAWGMARFGKKLLIAESNNHFEALLPLPPEALRIEPDVASRLHKLGLHQVRQFIGLPRPSLRRRFGQQLLSQLDKSIGTEVETINPVHPIEPFQERLPCLDPIVTAAGIEIALKQLLGSLCAQLQQKQKGLRAASFKGYRIDGKIEQIDIATSRPSHHVSHIFRLFETKLPSIEPALGIELFILEANRVEDYLPQQEKMWQEPGGLNDVGLSELIDRFVIRFGTTAVHRYLPDEHYWPERSFKPASSLQERLMSTWNNEKLQPIQLLNPPEQIDVTAPIPDYPPILFIYKQKIHRIVKADGPKRIEQEWWLQQGLHRDYYQVEDEGGNRFWLFRLGHYHDKNYQWFIHGFFC